MVNSLDLNNGTAENLSLLQRNAGLLGLFQRISVGHQLPERELVLTHPLQEKRKIGLGFCGTEAPTIVALVQKDCVQVDRDIGDGNPEEHRHATLVVRPWSSLPDCLQNLESGRRRADRVQGIVNSAWVDRPDRIYSVGVRGIDTMGSTELPGKLQLTVVQIHRDNGVSASNSGGAYRRQTDASNAEYSHRLATPDLRCMQHRAGSGQYGAANEAGDIGR